MLKYQFYKHYYYFGTGVYFIGLILYTLVNILYEVKKPPSNATHPLPSLDCLNYNDNNAVFIIIGVVYRKIFNG